MKKILDVAIRNDPGDYRALFLRVSDNLQDNGDPSQAAGDLAFIANQAGNMPAGRYARFLLQKLKDYVESGLENVPDDDEAKKLEIELARKLPVNTWFINDISEAIDWALTLPVPGRWLAAESIILCGGPRLESDQVIKIRETVLDAGPPEDLRIHGLEGMSRLLRSMFRGDTDGQDEETALCLENSLDIEVQLYDLGRSDISDLFRILQLMAQADEQKCRKLLDNLCETYQEDEELWFRSAMMLYESGQGAEAFSKLKKVKTIGGKRKNDAIFYLGHIREKDEDLLSALEYWKHLDPAESPELAESAKISILKKSRRLQQEKRNAEALELLDAAGDKCRIGGPETAFEAARMELTEASKKCSLDMAESAIGRFEAIVTKWPDTRFAELAKVEIENYDRELYVSPVSLKTEHGKLLIALGLLMLILVLLMPSYLIILGVIIFVLFVVLFYLAGMSTGFVSEIIGKFLQ